MFQNAINFCLSICNALSTSTHFWCLCNQSIWGTSFEYYYAVASTGKMEDLLDLSLSTGLMPLQKNSFES